MVEMQLMTVAEVARVLRCCPETVRRMVVRGDIPGAKVGARWLIHPDAVPLPPRPDGPPPFPWQ